jgi:hypothetical protein
MQTGDGTHISACDPEGLSDRLSSADEGRRRTVPDWKTTMMTFIEVSCPYCGEPAELDVNQEESGLQQYVQDCPVCCQPWQVTVRRDRDGQWDVTLRTGDD